MNIVIRADASIDIGSGHVMRCITIAKGLRRRGYHVTFWMLPLEGDLIAHVQMQGFTVIQQPTLSDILIVDHYKLDAEWETQMRQYAEKIVVIDDLANRRHDCDVLLDQNLVDNYDHRYDGLVPQHCKKLLGPKYLIIRDEFVEASQQRAVRTGEVKRLLVFMGGSDPTHETMKIMSALTQATPRLEHVDVVVGNGNVNRQHIEQLCMELKFSFHCQINYMATLMREADFSIGAGGATAWERCYVGLPSSSTIVADNQRLTTEKAHQLGAIWNLGWHEQVTIETYVQLLERLPKLQSNLVELSKQGLALTENKGKPNAWLDKLLG